MEVAKIEVDKAKARELFHLYREHKGRATEDDLAITRAYREIAQGKMIIQAHESIRKAGFNNQGLPRLAIVRADAPRCWYESNWQSCMDFAHVKPTRHASQRERVRMPLPEFARNKAATAIVPIVPLHLRPKFSLTNYHLLWEVEDWKAVPVDPFLIRRLAGDLWTVLAMWDLTEVERAVLAGRVGMT